MNLHELISAIKVHFLAVICILWFIIGGFYLTGCFRENIFFSLCQLVIIGFGSLGWWEWGRQAVTHTGFEPLYTVLIHIWALRRDSRNAGIDTTYKHLHIQYDCAIMTHSCTAYFQWESKMCTRKCQGKVWWHLESSWKLSLLTLVVIFSSMGANHRLPSQTCWNHPNQAGRALLWWHMLLPYTYYTWA